MKAIINIKADVETKKNAQKIAKELGLPLSSIINAYLKEFVREQEDTFSVEPHVRPNIGKLLKKASADFNNRKNISRPQKNTKEVLEYLHS